MARLDWFHRLMLRLLPRHVRDEHGREIAEAVGLTGADSGIRRRLSFAADILRAAPPAHLDVLRQDLSLALRQARRAPATFLVAAAILAIGMSGNILVFSMVDAAVLRPLPYREPERLVEVLEENPGRGLVRFGISPANLRDLSEVPAFSALAGFTSRNATVLLGDRPLRVRFAAVDGAFFRVFTDPPALGRTLRAEDDVPGRNLAVVSHRFWVSALGADPAIIDREIRINDAIHRVVGVMPDAFDYPDRSVALWTPLGLSAEDASRRGARSLAAVGRLRVGVGAAEAAGQVRTRAAALARTYPASNSGWTAAVRDLRRAIVGEARNPLLLILAAAGLVLMIAIANVANLLVGRSLQRAGEMAIRGALGARTSRLARQSLTESAVLVAGASAAGLALALVLVGPVWSLAGTAIPRLERPHLSPLVVGVALSVAGLITVLTSLAPIRTARGLSLSTVLGNARPVGGRWSSRWQGVLVSGEIALAVVVLIGGGLVARTVGHLLGGSLGFDPKDVVTFRIEPPWPADRHMAAERFRLLEQDLRAMPGVTAVGGINRLPVTGNWWGTAVDIAARPAATPEQYQPAMVRVVSPGYFDAVRTKIIRGRPLLATDRAGAPPVVVVDEALARAGWGDQDALGQGLVLFFGPDRVVARVVGIAEAVKMSGLDEKSEPTYYTTFEQAGEGHDGNWGMDIAIRTDGTRLESAAIEAVSRAWFPSSAVFSVTTLDGLVAESLAPRRLQLFLLSSFGAVALLLAIGGVTAVLSLIVSQRGREIGLRMALGATRGAVMWMTVRQALVWTAIGAAVGVAGSVAGARWLSSLVYEVSVRDPVALAAGPLVVFLAAVIGAVIPGLRATRVDPVKVLSPP